MGLFTGSTERTAVNTFFIPRLEAFEEGAGVRVHPPVTLATSKSVRLCD